MRDQGAHIARIDIQVMLHEILTRLPDITPARPAEWLPSNFISGPRRLLSRTGHRRIAAQIGHRLSLGCQFRLNTPLDRDSRLKDSTPKFGLISPSKSLVLTRSQRHDLVRAPMVMRKNEAGKAAKDCQRLTAGTVAAVLEEDD